MTSVSNDYRFTASGRHIVDEDHLELISVGVDIGSSTSHLVFSRLRLEREGSRYVVVERKVLHESSILLTPYVAGITIDGDALERFIVREYAAAGLRREQVDTGALILTGNALRKRNARAIADLFAEEAGRFVAVSAGDSLEAVMAAHGSGAVARSARDGSTVLNVDIGGGTTKLAICREGQVEETAAMDVGARLLALDGGGVITRLEEAGYLVGKAVGVELALGSSVAPNTLEAIAAYLADCLFELVGLVGLSKAAQELMRTPLPSYSGKIDAVIFSGGVSEYIYDHEAGRFGDLGDLLAAEIKSRIGSLGVPVLEPVAGIRATVIGASQYTIQVSGNTIFLSDVATVPVRNVPVVTPLLPLAEEEIERAAVQLAVETALRRADALSVEWPVALAVRWQGSATYGRINALCRGIVAGMEHNLAHGNPLILVCDGDVGGLLGIHLKDEMQLANPVISIDGVELREFDYIDIGSLIPASGAVPVVIKSLVFPTVAERL